MLRNYNISKFNDINNIKHPYTFIYISDVYIIIPKQTLITLKYLLT